MRSRQDWGSVMLAEATVMCSVGGAGTADLQCSVLEEDWQTGQSYVAHWHSLTFVPQHHQRPVMEAERSGKHWEARRLLQRFLSGAISKNYPHPKTHLTRRPHQSVSDPSAWDHKKKEECCVTGRAKSIRDE
ncbi:hypothetical protein EYF80_035325 [Liparis tanakae]|uniref:Uncharacterized protein n=1 Tax=Liparis tanakae TaxID=230148 RepID=A0A4Z2GLR5_9TELE|nr:hypothetical protein EYF80_035325 [Liparis tanakae]